MIVLSKKRISIIVFSIFFSILVFAIATDVKEITVPTVSLPVSGKTIVIDAGQQDMANQMKVQKVVQELQKLQ